MIGIEIGASEPSALLILVVAALVIVLYLVPVPLWIAAWASGAYVGLLHPDRHAPAARAAEHDRHRAHQRGEGGPRHLRQRPGGALPGRRQRRATWSTR